MSDASQESVLWVRQLAAGEDEIVAEFWTRYGASLQGLARSRMNRSLQQRVSPEDVVQSVCRTFIRRARNDEFELGGTDSLWRLLCAITLTKVRQHVRFHYRQRRSLARETPLAADDASSSTPRPGPAAVDPAPTPAEIAEFTEEMQRLLGVLNEEEQALVNWKLEGLTQIEIAEKMHCSERTVRRILERVRTRWAGELESTLREPGPR
jgi:RNA polymerase sigma-70 factor, ECF subfamily